MKVSLSGLTFVAAQEAFVGHVYRDVAGIATIGFGHALRVGESFPAGVTHDQALSILRADLAVAESAVNGCVRVPISQHAFDALVSFAFNCGAGAFSHSSVLARLNAGDLLGAADALLEWDKAMIGGRLVAVAGLAARRSAEQAMFLEPDAAEPSTVADLHPEFVPPDPEI